MVTCLALLERRWFWGQNGGWWCRVWLLVSFRSQVLAVLAVGFVAWHVATTLVYGLMGTTVFLGSPIVSWYATSVRMVRSWDMFIRPPANNDVRIVGVTPDGARIEVMHNRQKDRSLGERVRDARIRKMQSRLAYERDRTTWGEPYLGYFCREDQHGAPSFQTIELEVGRLDASAESSTVKLRVRCSDAVLALGDVP